MFTCVVSFVVNVLVSGTFSKVSSGELILSVKLIVLNAVVGTGIDSVIEVFGEGDVSIFVGLLRVNGKESVEIFLCLKHCFSGHCFCHLIDCWNIWCCN